MTELSRTQRWEQYQPPKVAVFWAFVVGVIATLIIGFTWGGWVTGGTSQELAETAVEETRAELVAVVCVERFMRAETASVQLAALAEVDSWERDDLIADGGWATLAGMEGPVDDAADLCAERLMEMQNSAAAADA